MLHKKRVRAEASIGVYLPITPMLDMVFQLLLFFVVNYHPSALEGQIELSLPSSEGIKKEIDPTTPPPGPPETELPINVSVIAKVQQDATSKRPVISSLTIMDDTTGGKQLDPIPGDADNKLLLKKLTEELLKIREGASNKSGIKVTGDSKLPWEMVVRLMDACRNAKFDNVSFAPPPDLNAGP